MSVKVLGRCWTVRDLPRASTRLVLLAIADVADDDGWTWVSADALAEKTELAARSVRREVQELEQAGHLLRVECLREDGLKTASFLRVVIDVDDLDAEPPTGRRFGPQLRPRVAAQSATGDRSDGHGRPKARPPVAAAYMHVEPLEEPSKSISPLPPEATAPLSESEPSQCGPSTIGSGDGSKEGALGRPPTASSLQPKTSVERVFAAWAEAAGKPTARLDQKRRRLIAQRLAVFPEADLLDAVRGWRHSPFHCGQNPSATIHNDLDLLLRDASKVERFRDLERNPPVPLADANRAERRRMLGLEAS